MMKLIALAFVLLVFPVEARVHPCDAGYEPAATNFSVNHRRSASLRANATPRPMPEASNRSTNGIWKVSLLGLAALGFVIRKRL